MMSVFCLVIIVILLHTCNSNDSCVWGNLDLSEFIGINQIQCSYSAGYSLDYTPCSNKLSCARIDPDEKYMITQDNNNGDCVWNIATWDNGLIEPKYENIANGTWIFEYADGGEGGCNGPRIINIIFSCSTYNDDILDRQNVTCGEESACLYFITIPTKYACKTTNKPTVSPTPKPTGNDEFSFSEIGFEYWIVIIILMLLFLYCFIGCMINTIRDKDNIIPNYDMWKLLWKYIVVGCCVVFYCCDKSKKQKESSALLAINQTTNDNEL
eukprot:216328_1